MKFKEDERLILYCISKACVPILQRVSMFYKNKNAVRTLLFIYFMATLFFK